ncbi:MAG: hypothetical protein GXO73_09165 [Calditrichaeota bacterium]|nr:hypothetical protein [Calditrichota bacterium]
MTRWTVKNSVLGIAKTAVSVALLCGVLAAPLRVSAGNVPWGQAGVGLVLGFPQHEFKENVDRVGAGLSLKLEGGPASVPVAFGLSGGFMVYGSETRREPFSTTIPDVTVEVQTTNNLAFGHFYIKTGPRRGFFRPYVAGLVGFHYLFTQTKIQDVDEPDKEVASSTNFSDTAFSYGFAAGMQFRVHESVKKNPETGKEQRVRVFVDVQGKFLRGGEAEYLKEGSIRRENGKVAYDVSRSETDLFLLEIGVTVGF